MGIRVTEKVGRIERERVYMNAKCDKTESVTAKNRK